MAYAATYSLPQTPPEDYDDPSGLVKSTARLSLDLNLPNSTSWAPAFTSFDPSLSYNPMSPTSDPSMASPCNPFPTSSPFSSFSFTRPRAGSRLKYEDPCSVDAGETCALPLLQSVPQSSCQSILQGDALSRIPPPHSAPSLRRTKPCRFYLDVSGCKSGRWCNFKHPVGARNEDRLPNENSTLDELRAAVVRSRPGNGATTGDTTMWDDIPDVRDLDPDWGRKGEDDVHPKFRTQPCRNFLLGLCRYGDKCQFIHPPGLFPPSLSTTYPTSLPLPGPVDTNLSATLPLPVPVSVWGAHPGVGVAASPEGTLGKPEQMSLYYRTKSCKFFTTDGSCPHGTDCKFIHNPKKSPLSAGQDSTLPPIVRGPSWADDDREFDFDEMPHFSGMEVDGDENEISEGAAMQDMTNNGARKSTSLRRRDRSRAQTDASRRRKKESQESGGIFKPTWRVVGGGVMLAGHRQPFVVSNMARAENDEDTVLDRQPCDLESPTFTFTPAFPDNSPLEYPRVHSPFTTDTTIITTPGTEDDYDYDYSTFSINPDQYPPNELLRAPSPDHEFDITMGRLEGWNGNPAPRKKRVITGADLMRGLAESSAQDGSRRMASGKAQSPHTEKEKSKPRLTIAVPSFTHIHHHQRSHSFGVKGPAGYTPYPYPQPHPRPTGMEMAESRVVARTEEGDDVLDWGDEDEVECGDAAREVREDGEGIRRVRSTPPTPRSSASYIVVPILPKLPAESP